MLFRRNQLSVTWDIEPESVTGVNGSAQKMASHTVQKVKPGSIILLHVMYEGRRESRKSLPLIIEKLKRKGYQFVTVNELIREGASGV